VRQLANGGDEQPHFVIETLPKVGYRLTGAPSLVEAKAAVPVTSSFETVSAIPVISRAAYPAKGIRTPNPSRTRLLLGAGIAALALILIAIAVPWKPAQHIANAEAVRLTQAARGLIHERNGHSVSDAEHLLREAIAADPNYAPAWARLGHATWYAWWPAEQKEPGAKSRLKAEALAYIRRALAISPNLAEAQAIMGMIQNDTNEGLPWLQRAVRLDPDSAEAWMWLASARRTHGDLRGALSAFETASTLDPAWHYSARSYVEMVFRLRGPAEAYRELDRMARGANDQNWSLQERADMEYAEGRLSDSAALAAAALRAHPQSPFWARERLLFIASLLNDKRLVDRLLAQDPMMRPDFNSIRKPGWANERAQKSPDSWWDTTLVGEQASQLVLEGRAAVLVSLYDRRFRSPADFVLRCPTFCLSIAVGPALVIALRQVGRPAEADRVLAELGKAVGLLEAAGDGLFFTKVSGARLAALGGNAKDAKQRLRDVIRRGWMGQETDFPDPDIDPAFAGLRNDAEFQSVVALFHKSQRTEAERLAHVDLSGIQ
jgi:cytochrome c-type biogenesis protein CcmH/NrfG